MRKKKKMGYRENILRRKPDAAKTQNIEDRRMPGKDQSRVPQKGAAKFPVGAALVGDEVKAPTKKDFLERFDGK